MCGISPVETSEISDRNDAVYGMDVPSTVVTVQSSYVVSGTLKFNNHW